MWQADSPTFNATWAFHLLIDPERALKNRIKQRLQLGRYARQPIDVWDKMDVVEFQLYYAAMCEMLESESSVSKTAEDL